MCEAIFNVKVETTQINKLTVDQSEKSYRYQNNKSFFIPTRFHENIIFHKKNLKQHNM